MAEGKEYGEAMMYEIFICRAYKYHGYQNKNGAHVSYMTNLIDKEKGRSNVSHLPNFDKQLGSIKGYIGRAIKEFLKSERQTALQDKEQLLNLIPLFDKATSSSQILYLINQALDITHSYKEY